MIPFVSYILYTFVVIPTLLVVYNHKLKYQICPLIVCWKSLYECLQETECKLFLDELQKCQDANSDERKHSSEIFKHIQHPNDPAFCQYLAFDTMSTQTALNFVECIGSSGCIEPSKYTDDCANIGLQGTEFENTNVIPFKELSPILEGKWKKLFTTGWDKWSCQQTTFHSPHNTDVEPESWMEYWPNDPNVWRMDLHWWQDGGNNDGNDNGNDNSSTSIVFHMNNEMYPNQVWDFDDNDGDNNLPTTTTLKTKAIMWGTEAHENWYVLDYNSTTQVILMYYCAYTVDINRYDSAAVVWQKEDGAEPLTELELQHIRQKALHILGPKYGTLQRIEECH